MTRVVDFQTMLNRQPKLPRKRVLVIAEDSAARMHIVSLVRQEGYSVRAAQDSIDVLALVDSYPPDVIVLFTSDPAQMALAAVELLRARRAPLPVAAVLIGADATLLLDSESDAPRIVSNRPARPGEVLTHVVQLALGSERLAASNHLRGEAAARRDHFGHDQTQSRPPGDELGA